MIACTFSKIDMTYRQNIQFNTGWQFQRCADGNEVGLPIDPKAWEPVTLPHTPRIEPCYVRFPWQGICWYRREIHPDASWRGRRVTLSFGAGMQQAEVYIDGRLATSNVGGYLPFTVDLTSHFEFGRPTIVEVRLDNRDTDQFPPGKPTEDLDFFYSGGLYRGATLLVTDELHVTDPLLANVEAGGGVFVTYETVSSEKATVRIKTHVANEGVGVARSCVVRSRIINDKGAVVASTQAQPLMIPGGGSHQFQQSVDVEKPCLWHPDHPYLYTLETIVEREGVVVDCVSSRIGIRTVEVGKRLKLNGKELRIFGTNRHQEYPFIGYALAPNCHRRDAVKIKEAGLNFVRLAHYPNDPAFLDACDELGILVQAPIPGWQIFQANNSFIEASLRDIRFLIRRDRNHPSVIIWEPNFNETDGDHVDWCRAAYEIAHAEYPGYQCHTFGDDYPNGWSGWDVKGLVREYGDWSFGGNESTSRQGRGVDEWPMLQQAWNYQWTLNYLNQRFEDPTSTHIGAATWVMFDHNRGYHPEPNRCGMMDVFRLPKFVHYFYQSQRDPSIVRPNFDSGPMVFAATYWTAPSPNNGEPDMAPNPNNGEPEFSSSRKIVVYSNCDEVELFVNGKSIGRRSPDDGPDSAYSEKTTCLATLGDDVDKSGGRPFDGGNAGHLAHPPFTFFGVPFERGELKAVGYRNGRIAAQHTVSTPGKPVRLELSADLSGVDLVADGADSVFVHARIVDEAGTTVYSASPEVTITVEGPARVHGGSKANVEGGIASALVQAGLQSGTFIVKASAPGLGESTLSINVEPCGVIEEGRFDQPTVVLRTGSVSAI